MSTYPPYPGYTCGFCGRTTYLEADIRNHYCPCCGSADGMLPRVCEHHAEYSRQRAAERRKAVRASRRRRDGQRGP